MNLSVAAAQATMTAIADYTSADFDSLGITPDDFKLTYGESPWKRDHRRRVMQTIDALLFGTLDQLGLPRIAVPAEYVAAVISTFVSPSNRLTACIWMSEARTTGSRAIDLAAAGVDVASVDPVGASQLFALIVLLSEKDESTEVRQKFAKRMAKRVADQTKGFVS